MEISSDFSSCIYSCAFVNKVIRILGIKLETLNNLVSTLVGLTKVDVKK